MRPIYVKRRETQVFRVLESKTSKKGRTYRKQDRRTEEGNCLEQLKRKGS